MLGWHKAEISATTVYLKRDQRPMMKLDVIDKRCYRLAHEVRTLLRRYVGIVPPSRLAGLQKLFASHKLRFYDM